MGPQNVEMVLTLPPSNPSCFRSSTYPTPYQLTPLCSCSPNLESLRTTISAHFILSSGLDPLPILHNMSSNLSAPPLPSSLRSVSLGGPHASTSAQPHNAGAATPPRKPLHLGTPPLGGKQPLPSAPGGAGESGGPSTERAALGVAGVANTKMRARDLLRKHYKLGAGVPPQRATSNPTDPMDLSASCLFS